MRKQLDLFKEEKCHVFNIVMESTFFFRKITRRGEVNMFYPEKRSIDDVIYDFRSEAAKHNKRTFKFWTRKIISVTSYRSEQGKDLEKVQYIDVQRYQIPMKP